MENLVQAWLVRVEHFSAEVSRKRAELNKIRNGNLDLKAAAQEDQHLLARWPTALYIRACNEATHHEGCRTELVCVQANSSKYLCDLSLQRAQLAQKVLLARSETPSLSNSRYCLSVADR